MEETDPRPVLVSILGDVLDCSDVGLVKDYRTSLHSQWTDHEPPEFLWFWTELFVQNPELVRRMKSAYHAIGAAFADLERLHRHVYGSPTRVPPELVEMIRRRVLASWFANAREVLAYTVESATVGRAARDIRRHISEEAWRKEFSS